MLRVTISTMAFYEFYHVLICSDQVRSRDESSDMAIRSELAF